MQVIEEEAARLDRLVGQAMEMAELDAKDIKLDLRLHSMREAVDLALERVQGPLKTHPVELRLPDYVAAGADGSRTHREGAATSAGECREVFAGGKPDFRQRGGRLRDSS